MVLLKAPLLSLMPVDGLAEAFPEPGMTPSLELRCGCDVEQSGLGVEMPFQKGHEERNDDC